MIMKKYFLFFLLSLSIAPSLALAQVTESHRAKITQVERSEEEVVVDPEGNTMTRIALKYTLEIVSGPKKGDITTVQEEIIPEFDSSLGQSFKKGDVVLIAKESDEAAENQYYILDHARTGWLYVLFAIFAGVLILVGRQKGFRALLGLALSFLIILKFIIPGIINGGNPLFVSIVGSFLILLALIFLTEGFNKKSGLAIAAISLTLFLTALLSHIFTALAKLSGTAQEETIFLVQISGTAIDFKGLLLAGILIGALGILDDIVISQIASIKELIGTNPNLSRKELFKKAQRIGISHISSMTNTLFLAYTGVSLPLVMLFTLGMPPFDTTTLVLNSELIATEVVRTLVSSIGLILTVPITNLLAVYFLKKELPRPDNS